MTQYDIWPVVFIGWKSKQNEILQNLQKGQINAKSQKKLHARKDTEFVLLLETGQLLAYGRIDQIRGTTYELFPLGSTAALNECPQLSRSWLEKLQNIPHSDLKTSITAFIIPPNGIAGLDTKWFTAVKRLASKHFGTSTQAKVESSNETAVSLQKTHNQDNEGEQEAMLKKWLPPILAGLLQDHVRSDKWELIVASAFKALGCHVKVLGVEAAGRAEPDCIVEYKSPSGQILELLVDAKAGRWNGAIDDIRAMRDYHVTANHYTQPLFIAHSLGKDTQDKLNQHIMRGKVARAITGRDLALLVFQRLTQPNFDFEQEFRRMLI